MAIAIPLLFTGEITGLLATLGLAAAAVSVGALLSKSNIPAKMKQWVETNKARVEADLKKKEPREPTPFTAPPLFETISLGNEKLFKKIANGEIWGPDTLHADHFDVYLNQKMWEKRPGGKNREVWIDGRRKA
eukprot:TRINITY_DN603_c0_g1_i1.p1 TRINITY_DN603_c0_g1~~TRINITY_DN603_c0_g1_i1.p1  ORF type:complete len:133 (+),score=14.56 TRINITY_DN603_c0_g1_i1:52-450(+)